MQSKRYLILPVDGIRLSDSNSPKSKAAAELLTMLQCETKDHRNATAMLSKKLRASIEKANPSRASNETKKGVRKPTDANKPSSQTSAIEVIKSLHEDGVKLVDAPLELLVALRQTHPGIRIIEEKFCHRAIAPRVVVPPRPAKPAGGHTAALPYATKASVVIQVIRGDNRQPVRGADVIAFRTKDDALEKKTNAAGKATLAFGVDVSKLKNLYVYHEEPGVWGFQKANVTLSNGEYKVILAPLVLSETDSLRYFHKSGDLADGTNVRVGVIDSGADTEHLDLANAIEGGANCVPASSRPADDFGPDGAHGTHVAGIIAGGGKSPSGMRGIAPAAKLRIYRVFEDGNQGSGSNFAVIDAIDRAIVDKCDIINLSLGFERGVKDEAISDALSKARNHGILPVAAAGNDGRLPVGFPGSDANCVAVSAAGRKGLFPKTATEAADVAAPFGTDPDNFIAGFSNIGADLDVTGAGVGVVSTFPGGYGPMSGTSMASPAVAGMAARLLSSRPDIMTMPRDANRSDAIRKLLVDHCHSLGFGILLEGAGAPK